MASTDHTVSDTSTLTGWFIVSAVKRGAFPTT